MKRVRNGATEPVMTEREMDRVTERVMDLEQVMKREMQEIKRVMERVTERVMDLEQVMKRLIETLSKQSAPADCNGNPRTSLDQAETSEGRDYQLRFADKFPSIIFTDSKIKDKSNESVKIVLFDRISTAPVTSGPLSSIKIQILVLDGDFGFEAQENWTKQDFNDKVVHERDGKRPLVTGELIITLRDGVGIIGDLSFTDNSSWIKCRKFRLGARVVQSIGGQVSIKEAISEAFVVKDHRTKRYGKHHPPSLDDEVWRLEKIKKDGKFHQRLASHQIDTVKDFMRMYVTNPTKLREMLDCPEGAWNTIVEHASTCDVNDEISFTYSVDGIGLLFNFVYKLVAAAIDGQNYQSVDDPTFIDTPLVKSIKEQAYRNVSTFVPVNGHAIFGPSKSLPSLQDEPIGGSTTGLQHPEFPVADQDFSGMHFDCHLPSTSSSYMGGLENHSHQLQLPVAENTHLIQEFDLMFGNYNFEIDEFISPFNGETVPNLASEMTSQAPMSTWPPVNATWEHNNVFNQPSTSNESEFGPNFYQRFCCLSINLTSPPTSSHCLSTNFQSLSTNFQNLRYLHVMNCNSLINMGTSSVAKSLVQLTEMSISFCENMTEVIGNHGDVIEDEIIFRKLKSLMLLGLPNLISFCSWNFTLKFPSLETLTVEQCPNMKIFSWGDLTTQKLQIVTIDYELVELHPDFNLNIAIQQSHEKANEAIWNEDNGASSSHHLE